jgi:gas vesicle protein
MGAAAGTLLALLYAPTSGQITRKRIAKRMQGLRREASRRLGRTKKVFATQAEQVREAATEWIAEHVPHTNGNGRPHRMVRHAAR